MLCAACSNFNGRQSNQYFLGHLSKSLLSLASSLYVQSGIKYVLTQGDSLLIAALASLEDQGSYALSSNYGGLIARMLFQPIEDSSRNLFARLAAKVPTEKSNANSKPEKNGEGTSPGQDGIRQANRILRDILKIYTLMSLFAFALGPTMAPLLLKLVAGSRWSDTSASDVLGTYCYYIPLLAINGVTEAFVAATATSAELGAQSVWMGVFFAAFAGSAYLFLRVLEMGAKGLVLANCVNMAARILFNFSFLSKFFDRHREAGLYTVTFVLMPLTDLQHFDILSVLPRGSTIAVSVTVPAVIRVTDGLLSMYGFVGELVRMGGVSVAMLGATYVVSYKMHSGAFADISVTEHSVSGNTLGASTRCLIDNEAVSARFCGLIDAFAAFYHTAEEMSLPTVGLNTSSVSERIAESPFAFLLPSHNYFYCRVVREMYQLVHSVNTLDCIFDFGSYHRSFCRSVYACASRS